MFGKFLGAIASAPTRLLNVPVKIAEKVVEAADELIDGGSTMSYRAPKRNALDRVSDAIEDSCKEAFGDE